MYFLTTKLLREHGSGPWVRNGKYKIGHFADELVQAAVDLIQQPWRPDPSPPWITAIPSLRRPRLVYDYAERLANELKMPFEPVLLRTANAPEQKKHDHANFG